MFYGPARTQPGRGRSPNLYRGVEQLAARWAHNPKAGGSSPPPATMLLINPFKSTPLRKFLPPAITELTNTFLRPLAARFTKGWAATLLTNRGLSGRHRVSNNAALLGSRAALPQICRGDGANVKAATHSLPTWPFAARFGYFPGGAFSAWLNFGHRTLRCHAR